MRFAGIDKKKFSINSIHKCKLFADLQISLYY